MNSGKCKAEQKNQNIAFQKIAGDRKRYIVVHVYICAGLNSNKPALQF